MNRWLVTGASGFLGRHILTTLQTQRETTLLALGLEPPPALSCPFERLDLDTAAEDPTPLARILNDFKPTHVIHAAGLTPPADTLRLFRINTQSVVTLLRALADQNRPARFVLLGSAAELGPVPPAKLPVAEDQPCQPSDSYGLSKWAATRVTLNAPDPLHPMVTRIFNPVGPGTPRSQVFGRFAAMLLEASSSPEQPRVWPARDLEARRDFIDVRDAAEAVIAIARLGRSREIYHVGTGLSYSVREGLEILIALSGREVLLQPADSSPRGPRDSRALIRKIVAECGWRPSRSFRQSLEGLWESLSQMPGAAPPPAPEKPTAAQDRRSPSRTPHSAGLPRNDSSTLVPRPRLLAPNRAAPPRKPV